MSASNIDLIPAGTVFSAVDIIHYADPDMRDLDQAIAEADLLVTVPHATAAIPEELAEFLAPELTRRMQFDFSDAGAASVAIRWAQIDPRVVVVVNPHSRLVRDPNRPMPVDLRGDLGRAFERVRAAGASGGSDSQPVDLSGVDAVRPVSFSNVPILRAPESDEQLDRLAHALLSVAEGGVDIYEATCVELTRRFIEHAKQEGGAFTRLSFHDSANARLTPAGAIEEIRDDEHLMPAVVTLSNRGDAHGEQRDPSKPLTMPAEALRRLAAAHRAGFEVSAPEAVLLNQPYRGGDEIVAAAAHFHSVADRAAEAGERLVLGAVQAEFSRDYVLGPGALEELRAAGTSWVDEDRERIDIIAYASKRAWDEFRDEA
ncbi:N-formylglutamate amidohydrolase [Leucobacter sp. USHLN153]|uniref:N-formylglutamate amidohydrolase n=1 Tax=Leucobacter sp. USHLN153 TaxID=3081268 RepID=UPI003017D438